MITSSPRLQKPVALACCSAMSFKYRRKMTKTRPSSPVMMPTHFLLVVAWIVAFVQVVQCSSPKASKLSPNSDFSPTSASSLTSSPVPKSACAKPCQNGVCDEEAAECRCFPGWTGGECHLCGGKIRLNSTKGWLADAFGNYTVDNKCTWLIEAPSDNDRIRLHIKEFATECGWDHLYVFDGDSVFSELRAVFSGMIRQDRYQVLRVPELIGESGKMLLHFYSDVAYNMTGFNITFSINDCPSERHDVTCSRHGTCDKSSGKCRCDEDFNGEACSVPACPNNCKDENGVQRGKCVKAEKRCQCFAGWTGESCTQSIAHGYWKVLNENLDENNPIVPRTSHSAMVDQWNRMWIIGGETFDGKASHMVATYQIPKINVDGSLTGGAWQQVHIHSEKGPSARYGHSAVIYDNKIYMYGGTMRSGHVSKEIWALDLDSLTWERLSTTEGQCSVQADYKVCGPLHSMGHTAHVIANRMIIIFGHSPTYGYLNTVQEYHFGNNEWSIITTKGYPMRGVFGHSSVWDEVTQLIYVYGGFVSTMSTSAAISNELYSFDPRYRIWKYHSSSESYRFLHSAVASHGLMLIFGGNTHNDTSYSEGAKCFSADFLAYDILCDRWINYQDLVPKDLNADLDRFGHSAVSQNMSMIIFGGFTGVLKNDVLAFASGDCEIFKTRKECLTSKVGIKCVWDNKKGSCAMLSAEIPKSDMDVCEVESSTTSAAVNKSEICRLLKSCSSCVSTTAGCVWCGSSCRWQQCHGGNEGSIESEGIDKALEFDKGEQTLSSALLSKTQTKAVSLLDHCHTESAKERCARLHTCHACAAQEGCEWHTEKMAKCKEAKSSGSSGDKLLTDNGPDSVCGTTCMEHKTCSNCTRGVCMWCKNLALCVDRNAYLASFPYGQCMDWTTQSNECPGTDESKPADTCIGYKTCESCRNNPSCGWCDDGSNTGLGVCMMGGARGPMEERMLSHGHHEWVVAHTCRAEDDKTWHFTTCPKCQCHGHSNCSVEANKCDQPCQGNTEGEHCERCTNGFFGDAVNGGKCQACKCNGQASTCNHKSGRCHCTTKGITGDHCEKCDKVNHYYGDPVKESCFYDLAIDYQFTFNLTKSDDKHFTAINFKNKPTKMDVDVDFSIASSVPAKMNLTYRFTPANSKESKETVLHAQVNCSSFKERFSKDQYVFGSEENTTFYVYVYDFEPPLWIVISFSQHPKLDLLQFFITFSTCFLALLLVAAVLWKIKQRYDRYRRRQRLFVEMEQMASRPFGSIFVELERLPDMNNGNTSISSSSTNKDHYMGTAGSGGSNRASGGHDEIITVGTGSGGMGRKRKHRYRPSPIALEPCEGNRAAVLSLIVRLPTGGKSYASPGYTGIAVASSLVTLGNHRKTSTDLTPKQSVDDSKSTRKGRKGPNAQPADI